MASEMVSSILAFRALNFLLEMYSYKFSSENLQILGNEMQAVAGHPCGDPALGATWKKLWSEQAERTYEDAARVACDFIEEEGDWGSDDGNERLASQLRDAAENKNDEMWLDWRYVLGKARELSNPGAWSPL